MKTTMKLAAMALMLGMAAPAFAQTATETNPQENMKDSIKSDTAPHANQPGYMEPQAAAPMAAPAHPMMEHHAMMHKKMENMTPEQRAAWQAKRDAWNKMTPDQRAAAKAKWQAEHPGMQHPMHSGMEHPMHPGMHPAMAPATTGTVSDHPGNAMGGNTHNMQAAPNGQ